MLLDTPCREYQGDRHENGYGIRHIGAGRTRYVHRQIMEMAGHDIQGKVVRHLCDNPSCFRYDHLRIGTQADNMADMNSKDRGRQGAGWAERTHCKNGHEFTEENTYHAPNKAGRICRECGRIAVRRRRGTVI